MPVDTLKSMGRVIRHRGPDDSGIYQSAGVGIGNQRLSIIDLEGGHQPFVSDDGQIAVVQNGEIFNYVELMDDLRQSGYHFMTHSDTEVLLRLYERDGISFVSKLNGMFSIAIYDKKQNSLYLIRDRIGVKPLYIHDDGKRLLFASEIKSLFQAGVDAEMNLTALDQYLSYNYVPPPATFFKGIEHVMPGHILHVDLGSTTAQSWWDLTRLVDEQQRTDGQWIEEILSTLNDAVRIRMRSDAPFGAFLSGGIDSSTVVGLMSQHSSVPVSTYSIGFQDERFDESVYALEAANRFGTRHYAEEVSLKMTDLWPLVLYHTDQPHGDVSFMPTYRVSELASRHVKMVLTGDGGDELFAGYEKYRNFFSDPGVESLTADQFETQYCQNISLFKDFEKERLYTSATKEMLDGSDPWINVKNILSSVSHVSRINQALIIDMLLLLPGNNLVKPDRMAMAVSLETRTPFLDYRMMELAFKIPGSLKLKNNETKHILKRAVEPLIGENLTYRKKQMFTVPIGEWLKGELYGQMKDLLLSQTALARDLFNMPYIEMMMQKHLSGESNYTRELRALMAIEIWYKIFINKDTDTLGVHIKT